MHVFICLVKVQHTAHLTVNTMNNQNISQLATSFRHKTQPNVYEIRCRFAVVAYATDDNPLFFSGLSVGVPALLHLLLHIKDLFQNNVGLFFRLTPEIRLVSGYPACFSGIRLFGLIVGDTRPDSRIITKIKFFE